MELFSPLREVSEVVNAFNRVADATQTLSQAVAAVDTTDMPQTGTEYIQNMGYYCDAALRMIGSYEPIVSEIVEQLDLDIDINKDKAVA